MNNEKVTIHLNFEDYEGDKGLISQSIKIDTPEIEEQMYLYIAEAIIDAFKSGYSNNSIIIEEKFVTKEVFDKVNEKLLEIRHLKLKRLESSHYSVYNAYIIDFNLAKYHDISTGKEPVYDNMIMIDSKNVEYDFINVKLQVLKSRNPQHIQYPYESIFGNDVGRFNFIKNDPNIINENTWMCEHCGFIFKFSENEKHIGNILECKNCRKNSIVLDEDEFVTKGINPAENLMSELWNTDNIFVVTGDQNKDLKKALEDIKEDKWIKVINLAFLLYNISKCKKYKIFKLEYTTANVPVAVHQIKDYMARNFNVKISVTSLNSNTIIFI